MKKELFIMCGVPGSGKSTKAKEIAEFHDFTYISRDMIRHGYGLGHEQKEQKVIKKLFLASIEAAFLREESVVADATHLTPGSRKPLVELAKQYNVPIYAIVMNTPHEVCFVRNSKRMDPDLVPSDRIRSMARNFKIPDESENFIHILTYGENSTK